MHSEGCKKKYRHSTLYETIIFNSQQHKTVTYRAIYIRDMISLHTLTETAMDKWKRAKKLFIIKHLNESASILNFYVTRMSQRK